MLQVVPVASCSYPVYLWEESGSIFNITTLGCIPCGLTVLGMFSCFKWSVNQHCSTIHNTLFFQTQPLSTRTWEASKQPLPVSTTAKKATSNLAFSVVLITGSTVPQSGGANLAIHTALVYFWKLFLLPFISFASLNDSWALTLLTLSRHSWPRSLYSYHTECTPSTFWMLLFYAWAQPCSRPLISHTLGWTIPVL